MLCLNVRLSKDCEGIQADRQADYPDSHISSLSTIWGPTLEIKISKIGLRYVLSWPILGLEPKFHDSGTFGGFGKRGQTFIRYPVVFNTGPYGDPP